MIKAIISAWSWFKKTFVDHTQSAASVAVTVTETIKVLLANPVVNLLENVLDTVTGTQIPAEIATKINSIIPKILAVELGLQGLPANATADQILAFENSILKAFDVTANNSKLYTVLSAQIYGIVQNAIANGTTNFAGWVDAVEQAYLDYQKDLGANAVVIAATTK